MSQQFQQITMPKTALICSQKGQLKQIGIRFEEIVIQSLGNLPKLTGVDILLFEDFTDSPLVTMDLL